MFSLFYFIYFLDILLLLGLNIITYYKIYKISNISNISNIKKCNKLIIKGINNKCLIDNLLIIIHYYNSKEVANTILQHNYYTNNKSINILHPKEDLIVNYKIFNFISNLNIVNTSLLNIIQELIIEQPSFITYFINYNIDKNIFNLVYTYYYPKFHFIPKFNYDLYNPFNEKLNEEFTNKFNEKCNDIISDNSVSTYDNFVIVNADEYKKFKNNKYLIRYNSYPTNNSALKEKHNPFL